MVTLSCLGLTCIVAMLRPVSWLANPRPGTTPGDRSLGINAVYQDLALVNQLSVYHNMFLNREQINGPLLSNRSMRKLGPGTPG